VEGNGVGGRVGFLVGFFVGLFLVVGFLVGFLAPVGFLVARVVTLRTLSSSRVEDPPTTVVRHKAAISAAIARCWMKINFMVFFNKNLTQCLICRRKSTELIQVNILHT
jgi:hypothetical protein